MFGPIPVQRLEGTALLAAGIVAFDVSGWSWWWFLALLLAVDVSMIGYAAGLQSGRRRLQRRARPDREEEGQPRAFRRPSPDARRPHEKS